MWVSKEAIELVRRSAELVSVIEGWRVKLSREGKRLVGLGPFHDDREPSLVVSPDKQLWNCLGACKGNGAKSGGDVFAFVAKADGVSFIEAMRKLVRGTWPKRPGSLGVGSRNLAAAPAHQAKPFPSEATMRPCRIL